MRDTDLVQIIKRPFSSRVASSTARGLSSSSQSWPGVSALPHSLTPVTVMLQRTPCAATRQVTPNSLQAQGRPWSRQGRTESLPRSLLCPTRTTALPLHLAPAGIGRHQHCGSTGSPLQLRCPSPIHSHDNGAAEGSFSSRMVFSAAGGSSSLQSWLVVSALLPKPPHYPNPFPILQHKTHAAKGMHLMLRDKEGTRTMQRLG